MTGDAGRLGFYGFGAAAHIVCQVAVAEGRRVFAFTRRGDIERGSWPASWARRGQATRSRPARAARGGDHLRPAGELVSAALQAVGKSGTVACAGIRMSDIPSFPYRYLWRERTARSVANLTRADGQQLLRLAPEVPVRTHARPPPGRSQRGAHGAARRAHPRGPR